MSAITKAKLETRGVWVLLPVGRKSECLEDFIGDLPEVLEKKDGRVNVGEKGLPEFVVDFDPDVATHFFEVFCDDLSNFVLALILRNSDSNVSVYLFVDILTPPDIKNSLSTNVFLHAAYNFYDSILKIAANFLCPADHFSTYGVYTHGGGKTVRP